MYPVLHSCMLHPHSLLSRFPNTREASPVHQHPILLDPTVVLLSLLDETPIVIIFSFLCFFGYSFKQTEFRDSPVVQPEEAPGQAPTPGQEERIESNKQKSKIRTKWAMSEYSSARTLTCKFHSFLVPPTTHSCFCWFHCL